MRIAVSMRVVEAVGYVEPRDAISHDWIRRLGELALTPLPVPNALADPAAHLEALAAQGLLLTGGNDVDPARYGGEEGRFASGVAPQRDEAELALLEHAVRQRLPVLGSCRGMQLLNVFFGGRLVAEKLDEKAHVGRSHPVEICDPALERVLGARALQVNSYHRWGIFDEQLSPRLRVFARSPEDGSIEGFYHPELPLVGIMWHPERPGAPRDADARLLDALWRGTGEPPWGRRPR